MNAEVFPCAHSSSPTSAAPGMAHRITWFLIEASILFGATLLTIHMGWIPAGPETMTFQLFWIPIILLAMLHGIAGGVAAAIIATTLYLLPGFPQPVLGESFDAYWSVVLRDPGWWLLGGTIVGVLRSRQLSQARRVAEQLVQAQNDTILLTEALDDARKRSRAFERRIVSDTSTVGALLHLLPDLPMSSTHQFFTDVLPFLAHCVNAGELRIFIKGPDGLGLVARHHKSLVENMGNGLSDTATRPEKIDACFGRIHTSPETPLYGLLVARGIGPETSKEAVEQMLGRFGIDLAQYLDRRDHAVILRQVVNCPTAALHIDLGDALKERQSSASNANLEFNG